MSPETLTAEGCGFWIVAQGEPDWRSRDIAAWWECVIPDAEHEGRDHLLGRAAERAMRERADPLDVIEWDRG